MTREEAIERIKARFDKLALDDKDTEAIQTLIPELTKSEDERITKTLIDALKTSKTVGELKFIIPEATREECIAYLEKRKEEKSVSYTPICNTIKDKIREYVSNHFVADTVVKTDVKSIVKAMEEGARLGREECRPAEWSGEDEDMLRAISLDLLAGSAFNIEFQTMAKKKINWLKTRLKSCRLSLSSEWSEEDEDMRNNIIRVLSTFVATVECESNPSLSSVSYPIYLKEISWLKSLRPSMEAHQEQPKLYKDESLGSPDYERGFKHGRDYQTEVTQKYTNKDKIIAYLVDKGYPVSTNGEIPTYQETFDMINNAIKYAIQQEQESVAERFARIVRGNLTGIDKEVQQKFEQLYFEITGTKMYGGYND